MKNLTPRQNVQLVLELMEALTEYGGKEFDAELKRKIKKYGKKAVNNALKRFGK